MRTGVCSSPWMSSVPPRAMITAKPVGELSSRTSGLVAPETVSRLPGGTSMLAGSAAPRRPPRMPPARTPGARRGRRASREPARASAPSQEARRAAGREPSGGRRLRHPRLRCSSRACMALRTGSLGSGNGLYAGGPGGSSVAGSSSRRTPAVRAARSPAPGRWPAAVRLSSGLTSMLQDSDLGLALDALPFLARQPALLVHGQRGPGLDAAGR